MRKDKDRAIFLRKQGKSYKDISGEINVGAGTLSGWLSGQEWSNKIKEGLKERSREQAVIHIKSLNLVRGARLKNLYKIAEEEASKEFEVLKYHPLFIAAIMLYWGQGDKRNKHQVRIASSDPAAIKLFASFLIDFCKIKNGKLRAWLLLNPDLNEKICKDFWLKEGGLAGIPFTKSIIMNGKSQKRALNNGVCYLSLSSRYFKEKMIIWLRLMPDQLLKDDYYAGMVQW